MTERATPEGTHRYATSFHDRAADGHFREVHGLTLSSIGIGTYLGQPDERTDAAYTSAIVAAVESGINVADAASEASEQRWYSSKPRATRGISSFYAQKQVI